MVGCPWCDKDTGCRNAGDELDCDFKTLLKEPVAIRERIDQENKNILNMISKDFETKEEIEKVKAEMNDKLHGIRIMKQVYEEEFDKIYIPNNQMEFTHKLVKFLAKVKQLERKSK
jgi:ABC-type phosphate transport system auxiliary subunit